MRPDSPDVIFLMLGTLKAAGIKTTRLDPLLIAGLLVDPDDLEDLEDEFLLD